jgi:hypothetical protein
VSVGGASVEVVTERSKFCQQIPSDDDAAESLERAILRTKDHGFAISPTSKLNIKAIDAPERSRPK